MDMADKDTSSLRHLPAVATVLASPQAAPLLDAHGRIATTDAIRTVLDSARRALREGTATALDLDTLVAQTHHLLEGRHASLRPLFNLSGTVLHTKDRVSGEFQKIRSLEFLPNTGYAFPVTAESWHSVEQMNDSDGERNSLMLIYYVRQGALGEAFVSLKRFLHDARYMLPA